MGLGGLMLPDFSIFGNPIDPSQALNDGIDVAQKKQLADVGLNTARSGGATYADVRIGRYLNQFISTREARVDALNIFTRSLPNENSPRNRYSPYLRSM